MVEQGGFQRKLEGIEWGKFTSGGIIFRHEKKTIFLEEKGVNKGVDSDYQDNYLIFFLPFEFENLSHP